MEKLFALDEGIANARAFRAILENLHNRDLEILAEPHISAVTIVRAGILRAAIGAIMSCLDPGDGRGNRASVGQIIDLLSDSTLAEVFPDNANTATEAAAALAVVRNDFEALRNNQAFKDARALRNDAIAHILIQDDPTPTVQYDIFYQMHDAAEKLVTNLYVVCARGTPDFVDHQMRLTQLAATFWDTYFRGMRVPEA
ncbi:hypothetical protein PQJ75_17640 [Rhodoplanes sp. TEM]|uniref:HEPN AbiU2-like domain-containing protein n=1 Tax=Rhodoplanes tepidamans TaxID=200616 RepID=A0ABT5JJA1_RHOTP|nr:MULTISPECIES: hypothetical protein [Rhodoplanes]MDC7789808.1 hypothetical protein [Rhodoplanes tepidamans]MDC7985557.1 hypothetical protein [Rhodoplanes sp. TEM]MDQ0355285.1 hypothetical protein [Rhodoplanes tepidamans]